MVSKNSMWMHILLKKAGLLMGRTVDSLGIIVERCMEKKY